MAITVVQSIAHVGNPPATFSGAVTAGNTVFLVTAGYTTVSGNPTVSAVKLGGSSISGTVAFFNNSTTGGILSPLSGGNGAFISIWMIPNIPGGGTTVTYTSSGFSGIIGQAIYEVSGLGANPVLDMSNSGGSASGTAVSSGASGAITSATEIVFGGTMAFVGTPATNSGWTCLQPSGGVDMCAGYQIPVSAGGSYTWSQTSSGSPWAAFVATVMPTPAPSPFFPVTFAKAKQLRPPLRGRLLFSAGAPLNNPNVIPVYGGLGGAVRAALPAPPHGRTISRTAPATAAPGSPSPLWPARHPAAAPRQQPPRGRATSRAGTYAGTGPVFRQAVRPIRAVIPQNAPRGRTRSNPGAPVANKPFTRILITAGDLFAVWETGSLITAWETGDLFVSE